DDVVSVIGEEYITGRVDGDAAGAIQRGGSGRPVVAAVTRLAVAGDGDDVARRRDDLADHVAGNVGDEQVARGVHCAVARVVQPGGGAGPVVAAVTRLAVPGDGDDLTGRPHHFADHVIVLVGDEQVARGVEGHATRGVQLGGGGWSIVTLVPGRAVAGGGHNRTSCARGEARGAAIGGRDRDGARRQTRGRVCRHAVDQRRAADRSGLVAEGDRPSVGSRPTGGQVGDGRGKGDRRPGGRRGNQRREGRQGTQQGALFEDADQRPARGTRSQASRQWGSRDAPR